MRKHNIISLLVLCIALVPSILMAQAVEKNSLSLTLKYFNDNNNTHHLLVQAKSKIDGKFQTVPNIPVQFYINNDADKVNLLGKGITNERGMAIIEIPPNAKEAWLQSPNQNFVVVGAATKKFEEGRGELTITKAKIKIDTAEGKMVTAKLVALVDTTWTPIAAVDVVVGVKRLGGLLNVNETQTYPTDSSGSVLAEFKRDSLPGDQKGNIVLVASVVDNEVYGNLSSEMVVPWGTKSVYMTNFDHRSLFARRGHSPIWLELLAYSIVVAVWSVIIFLLVQIKNLKKLGVE
ncbi:MAG: hypothetical protein RLZ56_1207 [Bacteroidota bacterium]|jgi:hypothetical protein